jgi:hypothetical protein
MLARRWRKVKLSHIRMMIVSQIASGLSDYVASLREVRGML